jgi:hypothetical protein
MIERAILREVVDVKRVVMRDVQSYCGILLDDSNRKTICRLYFNTMQKYIGLYDGQQLERVPIEEVEDIFQYADRIKATIAKYDSKVESQQQE